MGAVAVTALALLLGAPAVTHAANELSVSQTLVQFPDTAVGSTSSSIAVTFTRVASGSGVVNGFGGAPVDGSNFSAAQNCQGATLAQGDSCTYFFVFTPQATGFLQTTSSITLETDGTEQSSFVITLEGNGTPGAATTTTIAPVTNPPNDPCDTVVTIRDLPGVSLIPNPCPTTSLSTNDTKLTTTTSGTGSTGGGSAGGGSDTTTGGDNDPDTDGSGPSTSSDDSRTATLCGAAAPGTLCPPTDGYNSSLPLTGDETSAMAVLALALVGLGSAALVVRRPRRI